VSDNWLRYVPADPYFQPAASSVAIAEAVLRSFLPQAESVESRFCDSVTFFDPGANWSGVYCSACGADAEPWWDTAMFRAHESHFASLATQAQCCGAVVSLNELRYGWPAAFGRFVLEAMNPCVAKLSTLQVERLGATLGCSVREIQVHL